jgi:hypothetical protein
MVECNGHYVAFLVTAYQEGNTAGKVTLYDPITGFCEIAITTGQQSLKTSLLDSNHRHKKEIKSSFPFTLPRLSDDNSAKGFGISLCFHFFKATNNTKLNATYLKPVKDLMGKRK